MLDAMEAAGAIPALVPFIARTSGPELRHEALQTLHALCSLSHARQVRKAIHNR